MTNNAHESTQIKLSRGVRYRWDEVRGQHQLLYPEGLLVLNETGAAIAQLCDGRSMGAIKRALARSFSDAGIDNEIEEFLSRLAQRGLVHHDTNP